MEILLYFIGFVVVMTVWQKIIDVRADQKASKQIPEIKAKLEEKALQLEYLKRKRNEIPLAVIEFRSQNERTTSQRPYYSTKKR